MICVSLSKLFRAGISRYLNRPALSPLTIFKIANEETANNKIASIATSFRETILEDEESGKQNTENIWSTRLLRLTASLLVFGFLGGSGWIIYDIVMVVKFKEACLKEQNKAVDWWTANQVSVVMSIISILYPDILELIGKMERFHPRVALRWHMGRVFLLYFGNLAILMWALFERLNEDQSQMETNPCDPSLQSGILEKLYRQVIGYISAFIGIKWRAKRQIEDVTLITNFSNESMLASNSSLSGNSEKVGECWESSVGQELAKLILFDMYMVTFSVLVFDFLRGLIVRYLNPIWPFWDLEGTYPEYAEFKLADNILHLIYNQGILWLSCYFAPGFPVIHLFKLILIFYLRCWSVLTTNLPSKRIFRASRSNSFYLVLLLCMLLVILLPIVYALFSIYASSSCGPYSQNDAVHFSFEIVSFTIQTLKVKLLTNAFQMLLSPTIILPATLVMIMTIYYLYGANQGKDFALAEIKNQLIMEREDFKKRFVAVQQREEAASGRKSAAGRAFSRASVRRPSQDNALRFQPSIPPSVEDMSPNSVFNKDPTNDMRGTGGQPRFLDRPMAFKSNSRQLSPLI